MRQPVMHQPARAGRAARAGRSDLAPDLAVLAGLLMLSAIACAASAPPSARSADGAPARESIHSGLELYESAEYGLAGEHFRVAAAAAVATGDRELAHRARVAECTSWLRARRLRELCGCADRLEESQRRLGRSDPAVNTLIAMGAIVEGEPLPSLRTPSGASAVLRGALEDE